MTTRGQSPERKISPCTSERRRRIYRVAAQRLQRFAVSNPRVRFDAGTSAITFATDNLNEALASFIEGACGPEAVGQAFDSYERALIEASGLHASLWAAIAALRASAELIERYVWAVAPEEAAEAQENNHRAVRALQAVQPGVSVSSNV